MKHLAVLISFGISASILAAVDAVNVVVSPPLSVRQSIKKEPEMRSNQIANQALLALQQKTWEGKQFPASPNIVAKRTTMLSPLNTNGQIIEMDVLTYYVNGKLRYATGCVDNARGQ